MIYLSASYKVNDFKQWHKAFVENENKRLHAGLRVENIFRDSKDPNHLTILMSVESLPLAEDYLELTTSDESLANLSVNGNVEIKFYNVFY
jgi:hypothetical protein